MSTAAGHCTTRSGGSQATKVVVERPKVVDSVRLMRYCGHRGREPPVKTKGHPRVRLDTAGGKSHPVKEGQSSAKISAARTALGAPLQAAFRKSGPVFLNQQPSKYFIQQQLTARRPSGATVAREVAPKRFSCSSARRQSYVNVLISLTYI